MTRSGSSYSVPRDANHVPLLVAASTSDGVTPVVLEADPITHALVTSGSGGGGGTQYTNGSAQATPTGTVALGYDGTNVRAIKTASDGTLKVQLDAAQTNTTGTITSSSSTVTVTDLTGVGSVTVQISGTYSGINVTFEVSVDAGTTWVAIAAQSLGSTGLVPMTTTGVLANNATIVLNVSPLLGIAQFRVRATAYTSGTANVVISPSAQFVEYYDTAVISDGTNGANIIQGDTGFNGVAISNATRTYTFSTSATGAQTILANTPTEGFATVEVVYTSVGAGLGITGGQFSATNGGTYVSSANFASGTSGFSGALGTTVNTIYTSPVKGNFFQIAVSALTSGTFTGTVTLRANPPQSSGVQASQTGTWNVGGATSAAMADGFANPTNNSVASFDGGYNGTTWDRNRNNTTAAVIAAGATSTQSGITFTTYNAKRLMLLVNITAGAGSVTVAVNAVSVSSYTTNLLTSTALTGVGTTALRIFDGATPSANLVANDTVPRTVSVTATVSGSITYGIDYILGV